MSFQATAEKLQQYRNSKKKDVVAGITKNEGPNENPPGNREELDSSPLPPNLLQRLFVERPKTVILASSVLYVLGLALFVWLQFGLVYFVASLFFFMWASLGSRRTGEPSAYSVFNEGCERLPGQMTAEHFERDVLQRKRM